MEDRCGAAYIARLEQAVRDATAMLRQRDRYIDCMEAALQQISNGELDNGNRYVPDRISGVIARRALDGRNE